MRTALVLVFLGASLGCGSGATRWIGEAWRTHAVTYEDIGSALRADAERGVMEIVGEAGVPIEPDVSVGDPAEFLIRERFYGALGRTYGWRP